MDEEQKQAWKALMTRAQRWHYPNDDVNVGAGLLRAVDAEMERLKTELVEAKRQGAEDLKLAGVIDDCRASIVMKNERLCAALEQIEIRAQMLIDGVAWSVQASQRPREIMEEIMKAAREARG